MSYRDRDERRFLLWRARRCLFAVIALLATGTTSHYASAQLPDSIRPHRIMAHIMGACTGDTSLIHFAPNYIQKRIAPKPTGPLCPNAVDFRARVRVTELPKYPPLLLSAEVGGEVIVQFVLGSDGRVDTTHFQILRSTHNLFTNAVRAAVTSWKGDPALLGSEAYPQWLAVDVQFQTKCATEGHPPV